MGRNNLSPRCLRDRIKAEQAEMAVICFLSKDQTPKEEIGKKLQPFRKQIEELKKEKEKLTLGMHYTQPGTHPTAGYSAATPVTDGKEVYVAFGNGLVACFDLDGNRKWLKLIEHSNAPYAHFGLAGPGR